MLYPWVKGYFFKRFFHIQYILIQYILVYSLQSLWQLLLNGVRKNIKVERKVYAQSTTHSDSILKEVRHPFYYTTISFIG